MKFERRCAIRNEIVPGTTPKHVASLTNEELRAMIGSSRYVSFWVAAEQELVRRGEKDDNKRRTFEGQLVVRRKKEVQRAKALIAIMTPIAMLRLEHLMFRL